jgi:hypothetical protein
LRLRDYSRRCLIGTEINERTARVAKLNMLMHGLSYENILTANALRTDNLIPPRLAPILRGRTVDVVFANPPFAGYEKDRRLLQDYHLAQNGRGGVSAVTREVLFIERILQLLREGGTAAIVLPQGVFSNRKLSNVRRYLMMHAQILAIVELPDWAFMPSGTSVRGSLLFFRRLSPPPVDYDMFIKRVEAIGFTSTGRPTDDNEFPETIEQYRHGDPRYLVPISEVDDRLDAKFYIKENRRVINLFEHNARHPVLRLSDIGTFYTEKVNPRANPEAAIRLIETGSVDPDTLTIQPKTIKGADSNYTSLRVARAGDILISRRRAYRGAIVVVPSELDGALAIPEFSVLRLHEPYRPEYVAEILRSQEFLHLMTVYSTGEMSGRIAERHLRRLRIPVPDDHSHVADRFSKRRHRIQELESLIDDERQEIANLCSHIIQGVG